MHFIADIYAFDLKIKVHFRHFVITNQALICDLNLKI